MTVGIGCTGISDITKVTSTCREDGSAGLTVADELTLFPNPATGNLKVSWPILQNEVVDQMVSIMDLQGRMLFQQNINAGDNSMELTLSRELANGMYVFLLQQGSKVRKKMFELSR